MTNYRIYLLASLFIGLMSLLTSQPLQAQEEDAIVKYFSKYVERPDFSSVYISPRMFRMIGAKHRSTDNPAMDRTLKRLSGLRILSADSVNGRALYDEIFSTLNKAAYEEFMSIKEPDSEVKFLIKGEDDDTVNELLMLVGGEQNFFMLSIIGFNLDIDSVMDIAKDLGPDEEENEDKDDNKED